MKCKHCKDKYLYRASYYSYPKNLTNVYCCNSCSLIFKNSIFVGVCLDTKGSSIFDEPFIITKSINYVYRVFSVSGHLNHILNEKEYNGEVVVCEELSQTEVNFKLEDRSEEYLIKTFLSLKENLEFL